VVTAGRILVTDWIKILYTEHIDGIKVFHPREQKAAAKGARFGAHFTQMYFVGEYYYYRSTEYFVCALPFNLPPWQSAAIYMQQ
jgi:hypothetical protein